MSLYKYLHPDRIDVLENCQICFSSPLNLNDPFELKPPLRLYETKESMWAAVEKILPRIIEDSFEQLSPAIKQFTNKNQLEELVRLQMHSSDFGFVNSIQKLMPGLHTHFNAEIEKLVGILCLTEAPADLLMWAHYASSHEGFVIEFDPESEFFHQQRSESDEFRHLRRVHYSDIRPPLTLDNADIKALLTKSEHWAYEREWRMMVDLGDASTTLTRGGKNFHLFAFPATSIKAVILGSRMSQANKQRVLRLIIENSALAHVACYQADIDDTYFSLNINLVTNFD